MKTEVRDKEWQKMTDEEKAGIFEETALIHSDALYRTGLRLTRNEKDAEDLLQETFLRAYKSFHLFKLGTNCKAWLFKIMTNLHINNYQKKSKKPNQYSLDDIEDFYLYNKIAGDQIHSTEKDVEQRVLDSFLDIEVKDAIEKLPYDFRISVLLADVEGFRYQEIADILDCPIGTVRSRLSRGRRLLEKYLWDYAKKRNYGKGRCKMESCSAAVEQLVDYLHQEMDDADDYKVKAHLEQCETCCSRFDFEEKLNFTIKEKAGKDECPQDLKSLIKSKISTLR
ncbi:MAG: sigma-70 family RNA polymerase sigma factor [Vulcanimicrobiota bacterium]